MPEDRTARRRRAAVAVTREAKSSLPTEVEEGIGLRVLNLFDAGPGFYAAEEIRSRVVVDERFLSILLRKMVEHHLLIPEKVDGQEMYWDPAVGFDPRRGVSKQLGIFPLRFPLLQATKRARDHLRRRMLVIPRERLTRKEFYYLPLWRVEAEVPLGKTQGRAARQFYVNAVTGEIAYPVYGRLTFEEIPRKDALRLEPLASKSLLERVPAARVGEAIPLAKIGPAQAKEIVRTSLGAKPLPAEPEVVLLPIWRFDLASKADGHVRSLWIDGAFGSVFREAP
ncbi:MAG: hypothetical protein ACREDF_00780 [Thermoplasmata archaeon]